VAVASRPAEPEAAVSTVQARDSGWRPWQLSSVVEWCGHQIEGIPVPTVDGRWRLIVVEDEAT
jgi:hypothetical protein